MQHQFDFIKNGDHRKRTSTMVCIGQDREHTAMSLTVGLPLAMTARRILEGKFTKTGVQLPIHPDIYNPVLKELNEHGICFNEVEVKISRKSQGQIEHNHNV